MTSDLAEGWCNCCAFCPNCRCKDCTVANKARGCAAPAVPRPAPNARAAWDPGDPYNQGLLAAVRAAAAPGHQQWAAENGGNLSGC